MGGWDRKGIVGTGKGQARGGGGKGTGRGGDGKGMEDGEELWGDGWGGEMERRQVEMGREVVG